MGIIISVWSKLKNISSLSSIDTIIIIFSIFLVASNIYWRAAAHNYKAKLDKMEISYNAISHNLTNANDRNVKMHHDLSVSTHKIRNTKLSNDCQPSLDYIVDNIKD